MTTATMQEVSVRYQVPGESVFRWADAKGETLRDAAIVAVKAERWKLLGNIEGYRLLSAKLVVPQNKVFTVEDRSGPQIGYTQRNQKSARCKAEIVVVSTGSISPGNLNNPGQPYSSLLSVTVPADTEAGEIDLMV